MFNSIIVLKKEIKIILTVLGLQMIHFSMVAQTDTINNGIRWTEGLKWVQVKAKAKAEQKYIFVDCYATWCAPCKQMDREVYSNIRVGHAMNPHFLSIKVQMDKTDSDAVAIKDWYADAAMLQQSYQVNAMPMYLIFSPDGKLVHTDKGYKNIKEIIQMSKLAREPEKEMRYEQLEMYKQGKKDITILAELALFAKKMAGENELSDIIAQDYKINYLDKLHPDLLCTKAHFDFINNYLHLINSNDNFFLLCYNDPQKVAKVRYDGWSDLVLTYTISKEELENRILVNGLAINRYPEWEKLKEYISKKFPKVDANKIVKNYQLRYYSQIYIDWHQWAKYKEEMIKTYPPQKPYGVSVFTDLNGWSGAWLVFMKCNDEYVLRKAVEWVDLAIKLDTEQEYAKPSYLDTKASLLYKLGKVAEAIKLEQEAVDLLTKLKGNPAVIKEWSEIINLMKSRKPIRLHDNAVWDKKSLSRIGYQGN